MDEKAGNIFKDIIYGRPRPTPKVKKYLDNYGNLSITKLCVYRAPLTKAYFVIADFISLGQFSKIRKLLSYDDIYHLALYFELENNKCGLLEKNHVIQINKINRDIPHYYMPIDLSNKKLTLNTILTKTEPLYSNLHEFYGYNAKTNNCQRFIMSILISNNLLTPELEKFVLQNAEDLLNSSKVLETLINIATGIATRGDYLLYGGSKKKI